ncbi:SigB/SigF/SigG family RNA polymerase sigma factor [Helcococcus kunzii]|uniref:RNA polymerase sigma-70 factor, sigma-B/F/G subfamily n=1 Tax=Helcococcus kunzii ATCC 51366 TaxID=883114 RepID=H3NQT4_9FIRM|nr:SigB/SigF/SigG family RNA polymerase sigma factor [Helcococcus kunzii]EHR32081.1 RNA polymerase sigma-70 factor, sigma-B/F/G subfamily [Helcococcus kunzii ATCC 51366]QUY65547.1 SigB/SigF/SigG family RNA polymerase sigma factor [Helcococcus kunzii]QZO76196.1 SigB/SigF/SigG family RNA polymerase sigma factor [Helcococcus kunzii]
MKENKNSDNKIRDYDDFKRLQTLREEEKKLEKSDLNEKNKKELDKVKRKIKIIRDSLIEKNLYIAEILAKKYANKGIEYDDLYQIASLGLILAVDRFNVDRGFEFSSYATPTITGEIKRYFRDKGWVIRVPRRIQELSKRVNNAKAELTQRLKKNPSIDEIAELLEVSSEEIIEAMDASQVYSPQSIDKNLDTSSEDREVSFADLLGEEDKNYQLVDDMSFIRGAMDNFTDIEKKIVVYRYFEKMTQVAIAEKLDVSQMTVSRLEKKVIKKFREELGIKVNNK